MEDRPEDTPPPPRSLPRAPELRSDSWTDAFPSSIATGSVPPPAYKSQVSSERIMAWNTPVPPAAYFQEFDDVIENGAERLFASYEGETEHRRLMERRAQLFPFVIALAARGCALIFVLGALLLTAYAVSQGAHWIAGIIGGTTIAFCVGAFLSVKGEGLPTKKRAAQTRRRSAPAKPQPRSDEN